MVFLVEQDNALVVLQQPYSFPIYASALWWVVHSVLRRPSGSFLHPGEVEPRLSTPKSHIRTSYITRTYKEPGMKARRARVIKTDIFTPDVQHLVLGRYHWAHAQQQQRFCRWRSRQLKTYLYSCKLFLGLCAAFAARHVSTRAYLQEERLQYLLTKEVSQVSRQKRYVARTCKVARARAFGKMCANYLMTSSFSTWAHN